MPARQLRTSNRKVTLDSRPDRPDIRDRIYQPPLVSLPPSYPPDAWLEKHLPKYRKAGLILDQGEEGACTGFGLAAVINYLIFRNSIKDKRKPPPRVSTRMLYHLARKYDEWPGEDYEGSSCRGAMKGWFHHGVCTEEFWPYRDKISNKVVFVPPGKDWDRDAATRPLGAYYRVLVDSISDLQAAIHEVGAVYVSASVHGGWVRVADNAPTLPTIAWKPGTKADGGHAFALVGYNGDGFIVQNSWGEDWGYHGFALLTYNDWRENADDAWVAAMGARVDARSPTIMLSTTRTLPASAEKLTTGLGNGVTADVIGREPRSNTWDTTTAVSHALILGNDGQPDQITIEEADATAAVDRVCYQNPKQWLRESKENRRIAIYVHGGLNDLAAGLKRTQIMGPWFRKNDIYPIFAVWQSGYLDSVGNIVRDLVGDLITKAGAQRTRSLIEAASDARDYLIETLAIPTARPVWSQMKQNATSASTDRGGMVQLAQHLARLTAEFDDIEIHLVGHSAGAIALGSFLGQLKDKGLEAETVSLYAPACTVDFALNTYVPAALNKVINPKKVVFDLLSDENERADTVGPTDESGIYDKSLLYLVSRALEPAHKMPILGMEAVWNRALDKDDVFLRNNGGGLNRQVAAWRKQWADAWGPAQVLSEPLVAQATRPAEKTIESTHGCFDNWVACIEKTLQRILGLSSVSKLPLRVTSLEGF
jgi:hypothetical protein